MSSKRKQKDTEMDESWNWEEKKVGKKKRDCMRDN